MAGVCGAMRRRKSLSSLDEPVSAREGSERLGRVLGFADLTALGVGTTLGVGVFVLAGHVAKDIAGPSVIISFAIAALASLFAGLCYAEFGGREPRAGSAYAYSYVCSGELCAFVIGWNLILEYVIGSASVARAVSLYLDEMLGGVMGRAFRHIAPLGPDYLAEHVDFLAFGVAMLFAVSLAFGMKKSTLVNNILSVLNVAVVAFVIIAGCININFDNWRVDPATVPDGAAGKGGFFPFGILGTIRGAATCFYGFVGFDCIATTGEEVREPRKAIPRAILASLAIIFVSYFGVSAVLTLMLPYYKQDGDAPLPHAFEEIGWTFAKWIVAVGGLIGLTTSLFGAMFPLPRILYAMASDGLIFRLLGNVSSRFNTPVIGTLLAGLLTGLMASIFDLNQLVNMMSIGTLMAYTMVAACVLLLRYEASEYESRLEELDLQPQENTTLVANTPYSKPSAWDVFKQIINLQRLKTPTALSGRVVCWLICFYALSCLALGLSLVFAQTALQTAETWAISLCVVLAVLVLLILTAIAMQPTSNKPLTFSVPFVPFIPAVSIFINIYLMLMLDFTTWIRFGIWMAIGVIIFLITRCIGRKSHQVTWISVTGSKSKKLPMRADPMPNVVLPYNINYAYENCIELETSGEFKSINPNNNGIIRSISDVESVVSILPDVVIPAKTIAVDSDVLENKETLETSFGANEVTRKIEDESLKSEQTPEPAESVLAYLDSMLQVEEMVTQTQESCPTPEPQIDSQDNTSPKSISTSRKNSSFNAIIVDPNVPNSSSASHISSVSSDSVPIVSSVEKEEPADLESKKSPVVQEEDLNVKDKPAFNEDNAIADAKTEPLVIDNDEKLNEAFGGKISGFVSVRNSPFAKKLDKILSGNPEDSLRSIRAQRTQKVKPKHTSLDLRFLPNTLSIPKSDDGNDFNIPEPPKMPPADIFRRMHSTPASFIKRRNSITTLFEPVAIDKEKINDKNEQGNGDVQENTDVTEHQTDTKKDVLKVDNATKENKDLPEKEEHSDGSEMSNGTHTENQKNSSEIETKSNDLKDPSESEKPSLVVIVPYTPGKEQPKNLEKVEGADVAEEKNENQKIEDESDDDDESNVMTREELKIKLNSILATRLSLGDSNEGKNDDDEDENTESEEKIENDPENLPKQEDDRTNKEDPTKNINQLAKRGFELI